MGWEGGRHLSFLSPPPPPGAVSLPVSMLPVLKERWSTRDLAILIHLAVGRFVQVKCLPPFFLGTSNANGTCVDTPKLPSGRVLGLLIIALVTQKDQLVASQEYFWCVVRSVNDRRRVCFFFHSLFVRDSQA